MSNPTTTRRLTKLVALAATALAVAPLLSSPASADPRQLTSSFAGLGSDTTQELLNAFQGESAGLYYNPLATDAATGRAQLLSWNALPPSGTDGNTVACVQTKMGGATFNRPNGSSQGRRALSRAIDGGNYGNSTCGASSGKVITGLVDFARSSAGPAAGDTGTNLTYIPFGRDGLAYAYYATGTATPITDLTKAELAAVWSSSGTGLDVRGTHIIPCQIQSGSGTRGAWQTALGVADATMETAGTQCKGVGTFPTTDNNVEENKPSQLKQKGDAIGGNNQYIVGMSAAVFVAMNKGVSPSFLASGVDLGNISNNGSGVDLGKPYTGTGATAAPASSYYSDATFGRYIYNVVPTSKITSAIGNLGLKAMFRSSTSQVCSAASTIQAFGFLALPSGDENSVGNCGSIATKGSLISGSL